MDDWTMITMIGPVVYTEKTFKNRTDIQPESTDDGCLHVPII